MLFYMDSQEIIYIYDIIVINWFINCRIFLDCTYTIFVHRYNVSNVKFSPKRFTQLVILV